MIKQYFNQIKLKSILLFAASFILFTIIGTLSHELGHMAVAESLGVRTELHYASISYDVEWEESELYQLYVEHKKAIDEDLKFPKKERFKLLEEEMEKKSFLITLGGPAQTALAGIIGLLILYYRKSNQDKLGLQMLDWVAIFLSLFFSRFVFNFINRFLSYLISPQEYMFGGDELNLALALEIPTGSFAIPLFLTGLAICLFTVFFTVPKVHRVNFILGGFLGGLLGFAFWMEFLGPIVLP